MVYNVNKIFDDCYDDICYQGVWYILYVLFWMIGEFEGYNVMYGIDICMCIDGDGCMFVQVCGQILFGWVNGGWLNVGDSVFDISQSCDGFVIMEVGDCQNEVCY